MCTVQIRELVLRMELEHRHHPCDNEDCCDEVHARVYVLLGAVAQREDPERDNR